jgi:predicted O-methyltransferase YrrM
MVKRVKTIFKRLLVKAFHGCQHLGFDVLPRHFYSEIPDIRRLGRSRAWRRPYDMTGVAGAGLEDQLRFVRQTVTDSLREHTRSAHVHETACGENGATGFGEIEADFLHCFTATHKPRRILQIGCGVSTAICLEAARQAGVEISITCVDPYPTDFLEHAARDGRITLLRKPAEELETSAIAHLQAGDLFFVDSTHTLGPAGEVTRIVLEHLPHLPQGCFVHFHDIYWPYDYPAEILKDTLFFGHESGLLHGFLAFNNQFRILASLSMLHFGRRAELGERLPNYVSREERDGLVVKPGHFPSSAYLVRDGGHGRG